ncbi:hypothetical protein GOBAR_DD07973 [Gossypium barbadense]|nr:hypothetical protein GOBAR_DD07973 [Gossypium barbadense]
MPELAETYACVPSTERGRGILISGDPKSNKVLYTNGRSVIILDLNNPLNVSVYGEHAYPATVARFSPNGEWVASADVSGTVRIWGAYNDHVLKKEFKVLSGRIDDLQWSPDGMRIVACGDGKGKSLVRAFMWDSGTNVGEFDGHSRRVLSCAFKPTRPFRIVTCGEDFLVNFYEGPPFKFKQSHVLTVSADKTAKVWDISEDGSGKLKKTLTCSGSGGVDDMLVGCRWQNDHLVTVSLGGTISIFSASNLEKSPLQLSGHMKNITSLAVLKSDPKCVLSSSYDGLIVKWVQGLGYSGKLQRKENSQIKCFAAAEEEIVTSGFDNKAEVLQSFICRDHANFVNCVRYSPDGSKFISVSSDKKGIIFDGKTAEKIGELSSEDPHKGSIYAASWSPEGKQIWRISLHGDQCGDGDSVDIGSQPKDLSLALLSPELALVTTDSGVVMLRCTKVVSTINLGFAVTASVVAPDGSEAIVGGQDGKLHVFCIVGDSLKEEAVLEKHRGAITVIRYSPDFSMFASGDTNREAIVWDRVSREVKLKNMLYHTARINCLAWSPNNSMVATGSLDTCVIIYEVDKPASSRMTIKGAHLGGVYALAFTDEHSVVSSGEDACVRVWKLTPQ